MAGISYGKGASLPEGSERWLTAEDIDGKVLNGQRLRFLDARDAEEYRICVMARTPKPAGDRVSEK